MTRAAAMQIKNDDVSNETTPFVNMLFNDFWCVRWDYMLTCHDVAVCLKLVFQLCTSMKVCSADAARGQPLKWPTSNKSYRPLTILALRVQFSLGNRILKGTTPFHTYQWITPATGVHKHAMTAHMPVKAHSNEIL